MTARWRASKSDMSRVFLSFRAEHQATQCQDSGPASGNLSCPDERRSQLVQPAGQAKVVLGQAARDVCALRQGDRVPLDRDVRVVVRLLGDLRDPVDERHRLLEVLELQGAHDGVPGALPAGGPGQLTPDVVLFQRLHFSHSSPWFHTITNVLPTLADVLRLDAVRRGEPRVVAGADRLDARVRWVHSAEVTDIGHLLRGGELVLTTGISLPDEPGRLRTYVAELAEVGVSGLIVELGRKYASTLPAALLSAAEEYGLPLIAWARETPFIDVTEAVHAQIIDAQLAEVRASETLHEVFTRLSVDGAPPDEVIRQVARLAGRPVVLENLSHQVLAADAAGYDPAELLASWETRSRAVRSDERTFYDESSQWLVTVVGARGEDWGRLIIAGSDPPSPREVVLIERAATTLALGRLLEQHAQSLERQAHGSIISGILAHAYSDPQEAAARARALGVPLTGRRVLRLPLVPPPGGAG